MPNIKRANTSGITKSGTAISDVPDAPTIGTATAGVLSASVAFTAAATGGAPTSYTATSSPGSITGTGASSPITVSGLSDGTSYTFTVTATNSTGTSAASSASNSVVPTGFGMYESIATTTIGSGGSGSVSFTSIPSTYTHLQVRGFINVTSRVTSVGYWQLNGSTDVNNYYSHVVASDGGSAFAGNWLPGNGRPYHLFQVGQAISKPGMLILDILDYTNTNKYKTSRMFSGSASKGAGDDYVEIGSGHFRSTSAINRIDIGFYNGTMGQYSKFALYGIKGA